MQNQSTSSSSPATDKVKSGGNGKWMTKSAVNEASDQISHFSDTAREMYENAIKSGSDLISKANKRATTVVKEHPMQATLGGLVVGFLLGATLFRRRA